MREAVKKIGIFQEYCLNKSKGGLTVLAIFFPLCTEVGGEDPPLSELFQKNAFFTASLSKKNYATFPTLVQTTWEGGEREENEDLSQWLYIERRLGPRSIFSPELKVTRYFIITLAIFRAWKRIEFMFLHT